MRFRGEHGVALIIILTKNLVMNCVAKGFYMQTFASTGQRLAIFAEFKNINHDERWHLKNSIISLNSICFLFYFSLNIFLIIFLKKKFLYYLRCLRVSISLDGTIIIIEDLRFFFCCCCCFFLSYTSKNLKILEVLVCRTLSLMCP